MSPTTWIVKCYVPGEFWTKFIMQLINGSISVWICGVGQSIWDILLNYSQRIFGAWWVKSLQHGSLSSNLIGQNSCLGPRHLPRFLKFKTFQYPHLHRYANKTRNVAWKSSALSSQNLTSNFSSLRFERFQNIHTTQCKIDIAIISEDGKIIQTNMKHFLLLMLRNATIHNSIKFSVAQLHVSSDKFWNCLKDLKCSMLKNSSLLVNKQTYAWLNYRRTFVKHFIT